MNIQKFLGHHGVTTNPFAAEEASLDPVFDRMIDGPAMHPDFAKVLGRIDKPSGAVVFGEKGSGKTAIRLMTDRHVAHHNQSHPDRRVLLVPYDDLNPILDRMTRWFKGDELAMLDHIGLADHQDAILSRAVTRLVDALLTPGKAETEDTPMPADSWQRLRKLRRDQRTDLLALIALYDQPANGSSAARFRQVKKQLRTGWRLPHQVILQSAILLTILGVVLAVTLGLELGSAIYLAPATGITLAGACALWCWWIWSRFALWSRCRKLIRELRPIEHSTEELMFKLGQIKPLDLARQPLIASESVSGEDKPADDDRYRLTQRLIETLGVLGYTGMMVIMDRVDEPTIISGNPTRMRPLVWPMFDNKFFQQPGIGIKLLLPIELRHLLYKESPEFFQSARLDKQSLVDRLSWSGATLYDLCSSRLRACRNKQEGEFYLNHIFADEVSTALLVDALDQMHQPRDAFKFIYNVIQEHCRIIPEDEENFQIARLTLDNVRQRQAQRVQDLYRGLSPG